MISVKIPNNNIEERIFSIKSLFRLIVTDELNISFHEKNSYEIIPSNKSKLIIEDHFFSNYTSNLNYLNIKNLPAPPSFFKTILGMEEDVIVIYGRPFLDVHSTFVNCGIDIFATTFFLLSRWEEIVITKRDNHERFPSEESYVVKHKIEHRPIINEYAEFLGNILFNLDNSLKRFTRNSNIFVSCDVDIPFEFTKFTIKILAKRLYHGIIKQRSLTNSLQSLANFFLSYFGNFKYDIFYKNIKWIISENNKHGNKVAFYFIPKKTHIHFDKTSIPVSEKRMKKLLNDIISSGNEIGIHPGYMTYNNGQIFNESFDLLKRSLKSLESESVLTGGRQHFLRYDVITTPGLYESVGLKYDSSLGFADRPGFRCGICNEFNMFDILNKKVLTVKQRPLILMECSVISKRYMGLGYSDEAINKMIKYKNICYKYGGDFTLLWHNAHFTNVKDKEFYLKLIKP